MPPRKAPSQSVFSPTVTRLDSGVAVVIDHVPTVESAAIGVFVRAGTRDEPRGSAGVAHLVEHSSFRGTRNRSTNKIARDFENVGAYANAYTTKEETCYYVRTLRDHIKPIIETLADVIVAPSFEPQDVSRERQIITEEIRSYEDEPEEYIFDVAERQLFGRHPLGTPILGSADSVNKLSAEDVRTFHRRHYHSGSVIIAASGNIDSPRFLEQIEKALQDIPKPQPRRRRQPPAKHSASARVIHRHVQQVHTLWHIRTPGLKSEQREPLHILNSILGDGLLSRLNIRLRENTGLAYSINSQLQLFTDVGMLSIYAGLDISNVGRAHRMIDSELRKLAVGGIRPSELKRAKEQLRAHRIMSLESLSSRMHLLGKGMTDLGKPEDPFASIQDVARVTVEDVNELAKQLCVPDDWYRLTLMPHEEGAP